MKKLKILFTTLCVLLSLTLLLSGCGIKPAQLAEMPLKMDESDWKAVNEGKVLLENGNILFELDVSTSHFTVLDKKTGVKYLSVPENSHQTDDKYSSVSSELAVTYFESTSGTSNSIYSGINSVDYKAFSVESAQNAVRVTYTLRLTEQAVLAPVVLTAERFDELLSKMEAAAQRKMRLYYKKYSPENPTDKYKEFLKKYKYLKENPLYIFKTNATELDKAAVSEFIVAAGYDLETYRKDLESMELDADNIDLPLSYDIPIEYRLTDSGFSADIRADLIKIGNAKYEINKISLLPWFAPAAKGDDGYALLPDGSGAVVKFDKSDDAVYSARFYGADPAKDNEVSSKIMQNACMNMVAADFGTGGFMAVVKKCAEQGSYNLKRRGQGNFSDSVFTSFEVFNADETPIRREKTLLLVSDKAVSINPSVNYILFGKATPSEMAGIYREDLISSGVISEKTSSTPLYLEFVGYTTIPASFLGVPYEKKVVLSTIPSVTDYVSRLKKSGVDNIVVRLKNFGNGGEKHSIQDGFSLYSGVGTKDELKKLASLLNDGGGRLYLENDCSVVYNDGLFDSFFTFENTARQIDNTIAVKQPVNIVNGKTDDGGMSGYYVAPTNYKTVVKDYIASMKNKLGSNEIGLSLGFAGNTLISDFSSAHSSDRCKTALYVLEALKTAKEGSAGVMADGGNVYSLELADDVLNMPLCSSLLNIEAYSLPFYQMAIHSHVNYAGSAVNSCAEPVREYLRTAVSGASLYYSFITETDALLEIEAGQKAYPGGCNEYFDDLITQYKCISQLSEKIDDAYMSDYAVLSQGVSLTEYDNGVKVLVNFSDMTFTYNGHTVESKDFIIIEGKGA